MNHTTSILLQLISDESIEDQATKGSAYVYKSLVIFPPTNSCSLLRKNKIS